MAFKILSSDEKDLLTEEQRKSYENELAIYNERVKFVEQLEKFENAVVTPYEPKFVNISDVKQAPEVIYAKPEYVVELIDVDINSAPGMAIVKFDKPVTATVPKCLKTKSVSVEHIKKTEYEKPTMPQIGKTVVPNRTIQKSKQNKPELPKIKSATFPTKVRKIQKQDKPLVPAKAKIVLPYVTPKKIGQVNASLPEKIKVKTFKEMARASFPIDKNVMAVSNSKKTAPKVNLPELVLPEKTNPILPKTSVKFTEIKTFEGIKRKDAVLPKAIIPNQVNTSFKQVNKTKVELPEASNISVKKASIKKIDVKKAELPILPKASVKFTEIKTFEGIKRKDAVLQKAIIPNQVNTSFKQVNKTKVELPEVSNISVKKASIKKIDVKKAELPIAQKTDVPVKMVHKSAYGFSDVPTMNVPKINVGSYIKPELKKSELPKVNKPVVKPSHFIKKSATGLPKVEYPIIDIVPKTSFKKIDRKISSVPSISGITIPNAYANYSLKNLLESSKDKNEIGVLE